MLYAVVTDYIFTILFLFSLCNLSHTFKAMRYKGKEANASPPFFESGLQQELMAEKRWLTSWKQSLLYLNNKQLKQLYCQ